MSRLMVLLSLSALLLCACSDSPLPEHRLDGGGEADGTMVFVDGTTPPRDAARDTQPAKQSLSAATSGSRLEAPQIEAEGLSIWKGSWQDTQLGISCSFAALPDGSLRCLPTGVNIGNFYYEDENCSGPELVGISRTSYESWETCSTPSNERFIRYSSYPCIPKRLHGVGARVSRLLAPAERVEPAKVYQLFDGQCLGFTPNDFFYYHRATEIEMASFVGATVEESAPQNGSRLAPVEIVAEDGARERIAFVDADRGERCALAETGLGSFHCAPSFDVVNMSTSNYSDAGCTQPVALGSSTSCEGAGYIRRVEIDDTCQSTTRIFEVGAETAQLYVDFSGTCLQSSTSSPIHSVGAEVPTSRFAEAALTLGESAGRLEPQLLAVDVTPPPLHGLWDSQLAVRCAFRTAADGKTRCLPVEVNVGLDRYRDAQCLELVVGSTCPLEAPYLIRLEKDEDGCGSRTRVYARGAGLAAGSTIYRVSKDECVEATSSNDYHYTLGAEVSPDLFVEGVAE